MNGIGRGDFKTVWYWLCSLDHLVAILMQIYNEMKQAEQGKIQNGTDLGEKEH